MSKLRFVPLFILSACLLALVSNPAFAADSGMTEETLQQVESALDHAAGVEPEAHQHVVGEPDYDQPPLAFDVEMFAFTLVLFAIFIFVMRASVWKPLMNGLNSREERIVQAKEDARAARIEVEKLTSHAEQRLEEVYNEVKTIVAQARAAAEAKKLEIVTQAEQDAQRIKQEALAAIFAARSSAIQELEQTVDHQVALATEQIVGRRL